MASSTFMRPPEMERAYEIGEKIEVNCDHEDKGERVRGWLRGTIVQVDGRMIAVQFKTNIFLTDGWMVPDQILWFQTDSSMIRPIQVYPSHEKVIRKKPIEKDEL
jgi:hypothetical protein